MHKYLFGVLTLLTAILIVPACKDEHDHHDDTTAPAVTIHTPVENDTISGEVHMEITVTDEGGLHEMDVTVTKDADGTILFSESPTVHDKTEYDFHEHFTPALTEEIPVTLTVTVSDHSDHITTKTVKFKVKP